MLLLKPLESSIRRSVLNYAKKKYGALCKKLSTQGQMGSTRWPDDMILGWMKPDRNTALQQGGSVIFFIEFKQPGGRLTPLQQHMMSEIGSRGFHHYVVSTVKDGKKVVDKELK